MKVSEKEEDVNRKKKKRFKDWKNVERCRYEQKEKCDIESERSLKEGKCE